MEVVCIKKILKQNLFIGICLHCVKRSLWIDMIMDTLFLVWRLIRWARLSTVLEHNMCGKKAWGKRYWDYNSLSNYLSTGILDEQEKGSIMIEGFSKLMPIMVFKPTFGKSMVRIFNPWVLLHKGIIFKVCRMEQLRHPPNFDKIFNITFSIMSSPFYK